MFRLIRKFHIFSRIYFLKKFDKCSFIPTKIKINRLYSVRFCDFEIP